MTLSQSNVACDAATVETGHVPFHPARGGDAIEQACKTLVEEAQALRDEEAALAARQAAVQGRLAVLRSAIEALGAVMAPWGEGGALAASAAEDATQGSAVPARGACNVLSLNPAAPAEAPGAQLPGPESPSGRQLYEDVERWSPVIPVRPLSEVWAELRRRADRFTANLPEVFDLTNPDLVRILENHLRHEVVPGYFSLCARLKQHERMGFVYKKARDKATKAIIVAYPELAGAAQGSETRTVHRDDMAPSGQHHFGVLADLKLS